MSDRFVVEVRKRTVGIAVRVKGGFRFFAAEPAYFALEGKLYPDLKAVTVEAEDLAAPPSDRQGAALSRSKGAKEATAVDGLPSSGRTVRSTRATEEPPEWFRWAVVLGLAGSSALAGAVFAGAPG